MSSPQAPREGGRDTPHEEETTRRAAGRARVAKPVEVAEAETEQAARERKGRSTPTPLARGTRVTVRWIRDAFVANYPIKFVALVLALAVFVLVQSDEDVEISVYVEMSYNVPAGRVLVAEPVDRVRVTVSGSRRRIQQFDERAIERVEVDIEEGKSGEFHFTPDMFNVPESLRIVGVTPASTSLHFEDRDEKEVPIEVATVGAPAPGHIVEQVRPTPQTARIEGPESALPSVEAVTTREISLGGTRHSFENTLPLEDPPGHVELASDRFVRVEVEIREETDTRALGEHSIQLEPGAGVDDVSLAGFRAEPAVAEIELRGADRELQQIDPGDISVVVEVQTGDVENGGPRSAGVAVRGLPDGVAAEARPSEVILQPPPRDRPGAEEDGEGTGDGSSPSQPMRAE